MLSVFFFFDKDDTDLPSPMAPDAGRTGVAAGLVRGLGGGDAVETAAGLDDGFLRGRLGRTRSGENERSMPTAVNTVEMKQRQTVY